MAEHSKTQPQQPPRAPPPAAKAKDGTKAPKDRPTPPPEKRHKHWPVDEDGKHVEPVKLVVVDTQIKDMDNKTCKPGEIALVHPDDADRLIEQNLACKPEKYERIRKRKELEAEMAKLDQAEALERLKKKKIKEAGLDDEDEEDEPEEK